MPLVSVDLSAEENAVAIKMSTKLGISKQRYVHREFRKALIRGDLLKPNDVDSEMGLADNSTIKHNNRQRLAQKQLEADA